MVPFFQDVYGVSRIGVFDSNGTLPNYMKCVIVLKYLLMCPHQMPIGETDWITYRDFKDSGQS